jgi:heme/copper-type cytochrome/quinol oxidase subunit 3
MSNSSFRPIVRSIFRLCGHPSLGKLFISGFSVFVFTFSLYFFQRVTGILPDQATWFKNTNHGPWHMRLEGCLVCLPYLLVFIPLTFVVGIIVTIKERRVILLLHTFVIACIFVVMMELQWKHLIWLID